MNTSEYTATAALNAANTLYNSATLTIYDGTPPATPETALSGNTALVIFTFASTAFGSPTFLGGKMTAAGAFVAASVAPSASGTASFARAVDGSSNVLADYTVGISGTDIVLGTTTITTGTNVDMSSFTQSLPAA